MTDVCVVGGGIIGMSCAFELARAGRKVVVLERGKLGREASWAAGGILTPIHLADYPGPLKEIVAESESLYPEFCRSVAEVSGMDPELDRTGMIIPVMDSEPVPSAAEFEWLDAPLELEPNLNPECKRALLLPGIRQVRNNRLCDALAAALRKLGVDAREETPCARVEILDGYARAVTPAGPVDAETVLVAAGAWSGALANVEIEPVRGQMAVVQAEPGFLRRIVLADSMRDAEFGVTHDIYLIPRRDGRILIGSTVERVGFNKDVTVEGIGFLLRSAAKLVPGIRAFPILKTWAGLRPEARNRIPFVDRRSEADNLVAAVGHYRNGILLAPWTARRVLQLLACNP